MIKASELRVGNLIQCKLFTDGEYRTIKVAGVKESDAGNNFISWQAKGCCPADMVLLNESYKAVPLTEEWVIRFGFEKADNEGQPYFSTIKVDIARGNSSEGYRLITEDQHEGSIYWLGNPFYFVHQLQNLYFALTGEELTIKEPA